MNTVFALLLRLFAILLGYAFAALCASAFLHLVTLPLLGLTAEESDILMSGPMVVSVPFVALLVAYFAFVPAMLAILLGEALSQRDWLFYGLAGGAIGAVVIGYFGGFAYDEYPVASETSFMLALVGSGICGGIGYWLVAGRGAGTWRQSAAGPVSSGPVTPGPVSPEK